MNQLCKVCAEPAAGFHFGAFTCEGCKSFFGRTYNNLSQIHECKNGGQCIINKQNRTSCKACRLRKCLVVGMSKTGSRYGRRSNWFKIHCLLQEQCSYSNPNTTAPSFRSPVTPTLQDGSLPFVNSQLRDALHSMEGDPGPTQRIPIGSSSDGTTPSCSVGATVPEAHITGNFAMSQIGAMERRLQEEALNAIRGSAGIPGSELEASYREQLFEAIRRTHGMQPSRHFETPGLQTMRRAATDPEQVRRLGTEFERIRRTSAEPENRLTIVPPYEWDRRLQESAPTYSNSETAKPPSPHNSKHFRNLKNSGESDCPTSGSPIKLECSGSENETLNNKIKNELNTGRTSANRSPSSFTPKSQPESTRIPDETEAPMTEEERLTFLKTASKISTNNSIARDISGVNSFQGIPSVLPRRSTSREEMLYSPINNNIFPFPSYPPVWPSILPFPSLAKFYPPFNSAAIPGSAITFDGIKNPIFLPPELRTNFISNSPTEIPKPDSSSKKRILDAILQVQRESACGHRSPSGCLSPPVVSVSMSLPQLVSTASTVLPLISTTTTTTLVDQPIDLTVRRKRKMAKSEIMYQPGDEEDMESEYERDETEGREEVDEEQREEKMAKEILVKGTSEILDLKTTLECSTNISANKFEVPMKIMKLETSGDTLIV